MHLGDSKGFQVLRVAALLLSIEVRVECRRLGCFFALTPILHRPDRLVTLKDHWLILVRAHLGMPVTLDRLHHRRLRSFLQLLPHIRRLLIVEKLSGIYHSTGHWHGLPNLSQFMEEVPRR